MSKHEPRHISSCFSVGNNCRLQGGSEGYRMEGKAILGARSAVLVPTTVDKADVLTVEIKSDRVSHRPKGASK